MSPADKRVVFPPTSEAVAAPSGGGMKSIGIAAAWISALASLTIISQCLDLGLAYAHQINPRCGTGGERVHEALLGESLCLLVPYLGWYMAREARVGVPVARCAALAAHAAWLAVMLIVRSYSFW